eukprot:TRINITY_DN91795_c0_g1_i1.p1 TRINITY_DN91795_c0_g1~~TRINITY_DN91795_c0_g1_i1.p1  ORF type:complete len:234 (-),score=24.49 TRINITY_DN91795_c0_g1_i1:42-689(-)
MKMLAVLLGVVLGAACAYRCPAYDEIKQPSVAPPGFRLSNFTGDWYVLATNEPTLPAICTCGKATWLLDHDDGTLKRYHYDFAAKCAGAPFKPQFKGESRDPLNPGLLVENMAVYNHSVAPMVPHMIYHVEPLSDGNIIAFTYACLLGKLGGLYSFNVLARHPMSAALQAAGAVEKLVSERNSAAGGVFDVDKLRYTDIKTCWASNAATTQDIVI